MACPTIQELKDRLEADGIAYTEPSPGQLVVAGWTIRVAAAEDQFVLRRAGAAAYASTLDSIANLLRAWSS